MLHGAAEAIAGHEIAPGMANMMPATMIMNPAGALNILSHMPTTGVVTILSHIMHGL